MDLNYDPSTVKISLSTMCALKVVHQILEASGDMHDSDRPVFIIERDCMAMIGKLGLPRSTREMVENLLKPVCDELRFWYAKLKWLNVIRHPVLTVHGTVDMARSKKALLERNHENRSVLHTLASKFNYSFYTCKTGQWMTLNEMFSILTVDGDGKMLDQSLFKDLLLNEDLTNYLMMRNPRRNQNPWSHDREFKIALRSGDEETMKKIIAKASLSELAQSFGDEFRLFQMKNMPDDLSPAMYCLLFSKMNEEMRMNLVSEFACRLACALLKWPYQQLFPKSAGPLEAILTTSGYWKVLLMMARKEALGYKDCDYGELFTIFWTLGTTRRRNSLNGEFVDDRLIFYLLMAKDEHNVDLVLGELSMECKEWLLLNVLENTICPTLVLRKEFGLLQAFVRICAANKRDLLADFKEVFVAKCHMGPPPPWCKELNHGRWSQNEWKLGVQKLGDIVDKLIAETYDD